jgi:hypothetical protein
MQTIKKTPVSTHNSIKFKIGQKHRKLDNTTDDNLTNQTADTAHKGII